jgi:hypothetical protein
MSAVALEAGYSRAYREFYRWGSLLRGAAAHDDVTQAARHLAYAAGWKKFEPLWDLVIRLRRVGSMLPLLEAILNGFGLRPQLPGSPSAAILPVRTPGGPVRGCRVSSRPSVMRRSGAAFALRRCIKTSSAGSAGGRHPISPGRAT